MSEPFLGQITLYPYNFAPYGWMDCAGQTLAISQFSALFSLLGTNYGGNGTSTFQLPNLQGTVAVGQGQLPGGGNYFIGETGGSANVSIVQTTMPSHRHTEGADTGLGKTNSPLNAVPAQARKGSAKGLYYSAATPNTQLTGASIQTAGGSLPHNNIQPTLGLRYCIAMQGVFPTRS
jgi:microcystin-dependent protein